MLKIMITTLTLSIAALPLSAGSVTHAGTTTSTSNGMGQAQNSLTLEGSTSSSVSVGNNTAPCQQVNGLALLGAGFSNSRTLDWCLSEQMAKTLVQVTRMKGERRRVAIYTLCSKSKDYQDVLVGLGYCKVVKK
jgi:hypothetical protein